ncbi:hypothetical protein B0H10DRAFT_2322602 [Mycena sp. CBHHK59/15]|nr:hypothetical protein B0H10DRAFT_2322602 [Mycena sp. CBHHK59/15]
MERLAEETRADVHTLDDVDYSGGDSFADVLDGSAQAEISHAGEDVNPRLELDEEELMEDLRASHARLFGKRHDYRTCRNQTQTLVDAFKPQMEGIADAYIEWDLRQSAEGLATLVDPPRIQWCRVSCLQWSSTSSVRVWWISRCWPATRVCPPAS